jgi:multiple sugar transport system permease protein
VKASLFIVYLILAVIALLWLVPLYIDVVAAIKTSAEFYDSPIWSLPRTFGLPLAVQQFISYNFQYNVLNSVIYSTLSPLMALMVAALAGYGLAKFPFRGSSWFFILLISPIFFPGQLFFIPMFFTTLTLHIYNTQLALLLVYFGYNIPFAIFLMRNYFVTIPEAVLESARLDGASEWYTFSRIAMPLARPALAVLFIFLFQGVWNDFSWGLTLTNTQSAQPFTVSLYNILTSGSLGNGSPFGLRALSGVIAMMPTLAVFIAFQRYFTRGLALGAVKG